MSLIQTDINRVVVGLGVTGLSTMRFLQRRGKAFSAVDTVLNDIQLAETKSRFPGINVAGVDSAQAMINGADEIYLSPGIAVDSDLVSTAVANGARITGDVDLFFSVVDKPVVAITGTNGKSTVTSLVGEMLAAQGFNVAVGGNIGEAMLDIIDDQVEYYVLELSSFQLERASDFAPDVACILNISADHIDRHKNLLTYHQAKHRIYKNAGVAVYNRDDDLTRPLGREGLIQLSFGEKAFSPEEFGFDRLDGEVCIVRGTENLLAVSDLRIQGRHNALNAMAALVISEALGVEIEEPALDAIRRYSGLPHRCVLIAYDNGVRYIDDSKATNVGSTTAAIKGLQGELQGKLILIAGGITKGAEMTPLAKLLVPIDCRVALIGQDAELICSALEGAGVAKEKICMAESMQHAINFAMSCSKPDDIVLLSPACASMDMFDNYKDRGKAFASALAEQGVELLQEAVA